METITKLSANPFLIGIITCWEMPGNVWQASFFFYVMVNVGLRVGRYISSVQVLLIIIIWLYFFFHFSLRAAILSLFLPWDNSRNPSSSRHKLDLNSPFRLGFDRSITWRENEMGQLILSFCRFCAVEFCFSGGCVHASSEDEFQETELMV